MMQLSRRKFLINSSLTIAGSMVLSDSLFANKKTPDTILGIQLYSVRDDMKTDPHGTLKQLAAMGYKNVEHANYIDRKFYGYTATEFKKVLDNLGLKMPSGHTVMSDKDWDKSKNDFTKKLVSTTLKKLKFKLRCFSFFTVQEYKSTPTTPMSMTVVVAKRTPMQTTCRRHTLCKL